MSENMGYIAREEAWFREHFEELLRDHEGKWVVVHRQQLLGVFDSFSNAYEEGIKISGSEEILVKLVKKDDSPREVSVNYSLGLLDVPGTTA